MALSAMEKFVNDVKRKELVPVKVLMFLIYGGQATLYPYFTVHLKSLGVSIEQTAIIFAVQPVVALLVAPSVGIFADKIGNFKLLFSFFLIFSAISANLLLFVPPVESTSNFGLLHLRFACDSCSGLNPAMVEVDNATSTCVPKKEGDWPRNVTVATKLSSCELCCDDHPSNVSSTLCLIPEGTNYECTNVSVGEDFKLSLTFTNWSADLSSEFLTVNEAIYKNVSYRSMKCKCTRPECHVKCTTTSSGPEQLCTNSPVLGEFSRTFWMYLGIRLIVTLGIGLVNGLFDAAAMMIIQKLHADVGFQRFWATVAMCIFAPISGHLVDSIGGDYRPCFFMYGALYAVAAVTSMTLDLSMKLPSEKAFANLLVLLCNPEVVLMLIHVAALGICWGFLENFLFWFLESELKSSNLLMGLTVTVGSGTGLFMALVATWFTRKLGYVNVMVLAFAAYTVRYLGYSYATDPYECLIYEMMENFTVTLLTVGVTLYCTELASLQMLTTMMTLWNGLHVISGRAFGSLLGGFLMSRVGARGTFRLFSYGSAFFGVCYFLVNVAWLRDWRKRHNKDASGRSSVVDGEELKIVRDRALSSAFMNCSQDSCSIIAYSLAPSTTGPRRRYHSDVPRHSSNSLTEMGTRPRNTKSLSSAPQYIPTLSSFVEEEEARRSQSQLSVCDDSQQKVTEL